MIAIVVAKAKNGVIGASNDLPWYLPADLRHFKELTSGHTVVMGRKTFDSIVSRLGKPLPQRKNIVVTRNESFEHEGVEVAHSVNEAVAKAEGESIFIIGGAEIYSASLPLVDTLYITEVHAEIAGDTYFPELQKEDWYEVSRESHDADDKNNFPYSFVTLKRVHERI